ncbi:hypothetical protein [Paracoccus lutimaris]|uniref:Secreted protein n=1 Tax=Paracoccus lutimaris TaxID=1490030 RepID=A0A368Z926_9RHOB|nr:hypothetical protein [Paracoccus lutimaris]RCW88298.1 hypothetical protein DFP89_102228 [Paracoccus lutimaris]
MQHLTDRRKVLLAAGVAAAAMMTGPAAAQSTDIRGTVEFEGGAEIPKGQIAIYLEDSAAQNGTQNRTAEARVKSDGGSRTIDFSLPLPETAVANPTMQIVARLERADDGWLLARGSADFTAGAPAQITLYTVMY